MRLKFIADHPVLIDRYMVGKEIEVDAISDGENVFIPGIMEHIERAGVHSGDSIAVYPPQSLSEKLKEQIIELYNCVWKRFEHCWITKHSVCSIQR